MESILLKTETRGGDGIAPAAFELLFDEDADKLEYGFWIAILMAVMGRWLVA